MLAAYTGYGEEGSLLGTVSTTLLEKLLGPAADVCSDHSLTDPSLDQDIYPLYCVG